MNDPQGLMGKIGEFLVKDLLKKGFKKGLKKAGKNNPDSEALDGLNDIFNPELMKDPMYEDSDKDGISDYYDKDSEWNRNKKKQRAQPQP